MTNLFSWFASYPLPKMDDLQIVPDGPTYEEKRDLFCDLLANMKPGLTLFMMLRPGRRISLAFARLGDDWQQRVWDAQLMMDAQGVVGHPRAAGGRSRTGVTSCDVSKVFRSNVELKPIGRRSAGTQCFNELE